MKLKSLLLVCGLASLASYSKAVVLYDQTVGATGGFISSSWWSPDGYDADTYTYDDFSFAKKSALTDVYWRGTNAYGPNNAVQSFSVRFYASIAGGSQPRIVALPPDETAANYLAGFSALATRIPAVVVKGTPFLEYHLHLAHPLAFSAHTTYWIKIEATMLGYPGWGLAAGTKGNGRHITYYTGGPYFLAGPGDTDFRLVGNIIPTP